MPIIAAGEAALHVRIHAAGAAGASGAARITGDRKRFHLLTPAMTPAPRMVAPPPGVMSPSSPPGTENPQIDEGPPDNELVQPGRTRARTRAHHKATTGAGPADHALHNQRPPNSPLPLPTCHAASFRSPRHTKRLWPRSTAQTGRMRPIKSSPGFKGRELSE